jgi:predicted aconitase
VVGGPVLRWLLVKRTPYREFMLLSQTDEAALAGDAGPAMAMAMDLVVAAGRAMRAERLLDISAAHVDSCLYHGQASLDFARRLADLGARVSVPTTLNVSSLDLLHPGLFRGDRQLADQARSLMGAYESMGCSPTWTCAPFQLAARPGLGDQVAWGESNAIVFANSVLGARTNRYGDFIDICCAITGRAPAVGLHLDEGRQATLQVDVTVDDELLDDDLAYVALGHVLGEEAGTEVAVITGLDLRADEDRLKALGAAAASSGAVGMFHVAGVTPEAETVAAATGGVTPRRVVSVEVDRLRRAVAELSSEATRLGAVSIGTPHASTAEIAALARLVEGRRSTVPFYVNTGRNVLEAAAPEHLEAIEEFGVTVVTDTCTYITPIMDEPEGAVMTNSGKWAYYAPANLGVDVVLAGLADCVESAATGEIRVRGLG